AASGKLPDDAGEDSVSLVPALVGKATKPLHEAVVHHSANGAFAIRQGRWKLCLCPGSGGWSFPRPGKEEEGLPAVARCGVGKGPGEKANRQDRHPEVVARLTKLLKKYVAEGRSTPGRPQKNTTPVKVRP